LKRSKLTDKKFSTSRRNTARATFGSVARGETRPDSDYDFLIQLEPGRSAFEIGGLLMDLQDLLGAKVDIVTDKGLNKHIREKVLKEAIAV
jgi:predicted nucleotidyltransferase